MKRLSFVVVLAVSVLACATSPAAPGGPSDTAAAVKAGEGQAETEAACTATWLRLPAAHELTYSLDQWTVFLLADRHDPETLTYEARLVSADPAAGEPFCWVGAGPQTHGPVVVARVGGNCGPTGCAAVTYRVRATAGNDCSEIVLAFPYDHSGGQ